jgi:hypothetical protein
MNEQNGSYEKVREVLVNRLLSRYNSDIEAAEANYDQFVNELLEDIEDYLVKTKYHTLADFEEELGGW